MIKISILLLSLLLASPCFAQDQLAMNVGVVGGGVPTVAGCDPINNEVGYRNVGADDQAIIGGYSYVYRAQADCTGNLKAGYVYHVNGTLGSVKICIYTSDNAILANDTARVLVGCSGSIATCDDATWCTTDFSGSHAVTDLAYYWVAIFTTATVNWGCKRSGTSTMYWYSDAGVWYASPPDPLPSADWSSGAYGVISYFGSIQ